MTCRCDNGNYGTSALIRQALHLGTITNIVSPTTAESPTLSTFCGIQRLSNSNLTGYF